jgi:hypothetical protein
MKKTNLAIPFLAIFLLVQGCATVQPGNDPVVVHAEQLYQQAFDASDTLFKLEEVNRSLLLQYAPSVDRAINALKPKVKLVLADARLDLAIYKDKRTSDNMGRLNAAILALTSLLQQIRDQQTNAATALTKANP